MLGSTVPKPEIDVKNRNKEVGDLNIEVVHFKLHCRTNPENSLGERGEKSEVSAVWNKWEERGLWQQWAEVSEPGLLASR